MAEDNAPQAIADVVARLREVAEAEDLSLQDLIEAGGASSFVPAMLVPAVLVVSPLSGIPVFSSICGLTIAVIAGQMVLGRQHLWLPGFLTQRRLRGTRVRGAMDRMMRLARWLDRHSRDRLRVLTRVPLVKLPQVAAMLSGLVMPALELVPFSSSLLGTAVILFSVSFLARDGLYVAGGLAVMGIAAAVPITIWAQVAG